MRKYEYKVIVSDKGFEDFEKKVAEKLAAGWKPLGGIAFNHSYPHQAMARIIEGQEETQEKTAMETKKLEDKPKPLTANEAMKRLNDLT